MRRETLIARKSHSESGHCHDHRFDSTTVPENCNINMAIDMPDTGFTNLQLELLDVQEKDHKLVENSLLKLSLSIDHKPSTAPYAWESTNEIDQMSGEKRPQDIDGEDLPMAKRHASGGVESGKEDGSDFPMNKGSQEGPQTSAPNPVVIDLSIGDKRSANDGMQVPMAVMKRLPPFPMQDKFPAFRKGSVHVILDPRNIKYQYRLHKTTLARVSPVFANLLDRPMLEASEELKASASGAHSRFELVYSVKGKNWVLRKTPFTVWKLFRIPGKSKFIAYPDGTPGILKEEPINSLEHVGNVIPSGSGGEGAVSQDDHSNKVNQSVEKLGSAPGEASDNSTILNQTAESVENGATNHIEEVMVSATVNEQESSTRQETMPHQVANSSDLMDSSISSGISKDDSVQEVLPVAAPSASVSNAPEGLNSSTKIIAQHIYPEREFSSPNGYPLYPPAEVCEAYKNLFLTFYNKSPKISRNHIWVALKQCEDLISVAKQTQSVPVIRPFLGAAFNQFGQQLYQAIVAEPYRWLEVAITMQSAIIFKEAMIHIVGQYVPGEDYDNIIPASIPTSVQDLIISKVRELDQKRMDANERLFASTITVNCEPITYTSSNPAILATWTIVQVWRDWFCQEVSTAHLCPHKTGALYHTLNKSGNAYLVPGTVKAVIENIRRPVKVNINALREDLNLMKAFAQDVVLDLCENNSMVDLRAAGVLHLTCTNITDDDLPWYEDTLI